MEPDTPHVILAGAARLQVLLVGIERFGHGEWSALIDDIARLSAGELPGGLLSLPKGQDVRRCGGFEIVAESDLLEPVGAAAVAAPNAPRPRPRIPAIGERDAGGQPDLVRLLPDRELAAGRGGFKLRGTRLWHRRGLRCRGPLAMEPYQGRIARPKRAVLTFGTGGPAGLSMGLMSEMGHKHRILVL